MTYFYQDLPIPKIPDTLIYKDPNFLVNNFTNVWTAVKTDVYRQYQVTSELINFLQPYFDFDISKKLRYQILTHDIPIHKDIGRISAINYLIEPGGKNVKTAWYTDSLDLLYKKEILPFQWHQINTEINHGIHGIVDKRLSLTISINE